MRDELRQVTEFRSSPELLKKLTEYSLRKIYKSGEIILKENSYIRSIPIVIKGLIKVFKTEEDGREILLYYIKTGESCIMSFLGGLHNETSKVKVLVEEEAEILLLPIDKVTLFMREHPRWLEYIFRLYHQRFEDLLEIVNAVAFQKVDDRLVTLLQMKQEVSGNHTIQITHDQLAKELGTARVVVSRLLKQLETDGFLRLGRNKITLDSKFRQQGESSKKLNIWNPFLG